MGHEGMLEVLDFSGVLTCFQTDFQFWGGAIAVSRGMAFSLQNLHLVFNKPERPRHPWGMGSDHWAFSGCVVLGTLLSCLNLQCSCSKVRSGNAFCLARCQD